MNVTSGRRAHHADRPKRVTPDPVTSVGEPSDTGADAARGSGRVLGEIGDRFEAKRGTRSLAVPEGATSDGAR